MARTLSDAAVQALRGHLWTIGPWAMHTLRGGRAPDSVPFAAEVADPALGPIPLRGWVRHLQGARSLLLVVHGLGGSADSHYIVPAALAAERAGLSCLRLNLRGADGGGEDFYHAGLASDLAVALASPAIDRYEHVYVLGYSMGGHVTLRFATDFAPGRVRAVAAICSPIDLDRSASAIDRSERWVYRRHVLRSLKDMLRAVARRRPLAFPLDEALRVQTLRDWDRCVVAPRFGFRSAEHYYAEASVAPRLGSLKVPALLLEAEADPMVPPETVRPALAGGPAAFPRLDVRWLSEGGHVGFPARTDLGVLGPRGLESQVVAWLRSR